MSYSFSVKGSSKREAIALVRIQLADVIRNQPEHHVDFDQALDAAKSMIDRLDDDPSCDVGVNMNGCVGWRGAAGYSPENVTSVSVQVSAWLETRQVPTP